MPEAQLLDVLYQQIIVAIVLGTGGIIIGFVRSIYNQQKSNKTAIEKLCKRSWRIEKAFALFMKVTIDENKKNHSKSNFDEVEELVNLILKDTQDSI